MATGRDPMMGTTRTCACASSATAVAGTRSADYH